VSGPTHIKSVYDSRFRIIVKVADETVNNSDVLQDDDELFFSVGANENYGVRLVLLENSAANADIKIKFEVPVAATFSFAGSYRDAGNTDRAFGTYEAANTLDLSGAAGDRCPIVLEGVYRGGANAGTFQLTWAQNTAQASDTKVLAGSYFWITRL